MSCHLSRISYELFTKCVTSNVTHVHFRRDKSWHLGNFWTFQNFLHEVARTASPGPHCHASQRTLSRVLPSLARQIACHGVNPLSCQCEACYCQPCSAVWRYGLGDNGRVTQQDLITTVKTTQYSLVVQNVLGVELVVTRRVAGRRRCRRCRRRRVHGRRECTVVGDAGCRECTVHGGGVRGRRDGLLAAKDRRCGWYARGRALSSRRRGRRGDGRAGRRALALDARDPLVPSRSAAASRLPTNAAFIRDRLLMLNAAVNVSIATWRRLAITCVNHVYSIRSIKSRPRRTLSWRASVRRRTNVIVVRLGQSRHHRSTFYVNTLEWRPTRTRLAVRTRLHTQFSHSSVNKLSTWAENFHKVIQWHLRYLNVSSDVLTL